jgi:ribosome-associated translation inhibitor RaiA
LSDSIRDEVEATLSDRFADRIRRVEVYLQDMNAQKGGVDIRCSIEVSLAGTSRSRIDERATGVDEAVSGAIDKIMKVLERTLGRIQDRNGRVSMSGEDT